MADPARSLIERCGRGDEAAYQELVAGVEKPLISFIHRYVADAALAEDIFQETFVRVVRNASEFRPEASATTWIFTIARNLCLDHLKAKKRHREVSMDAPGGGPRGEPMDFRDVLRTALDGPEAAGEAREEERRLQAALVRLQGPKREALLLRVFSGLSYQEIAKATGSPVGTVKFRVHEAVQELAKLLRPAAQAGEATGT